MGRLAAASTAVLCGIAAGGLYLAVVLGSPGALILVYLTQLPLFAAGLWLGVGAAVIAGATATLMLLAASDLLATAVFAGLNAVPVAACWCARRLLARRQPDETRRMVSARPLDGLADRDGARRHRRSPSSCSAAGAELARGAARRRRSRARPDRPSAGTTDQAEIADAIALIIPGVVAASWMVMALINAVLAQGILARFKLNWRPAPDLAALDLPMWLPIALAAAATLTMLGDFGRFFGVNAIVALSVPFCLAGLGVLHAPRGGCRTRALG